MMRREQSLKTEAVLRKKPRRPQKDEKEDMREFWKNKEGVFTEQLFNPSPKMYKDLN